MTYAIFANVCVCVSVCGYIIARFHDIVTSFQLYFWRVVKCTKIGTCGTKVTCSVAGKGPGMQAPK